MDKFTVNQIKDISLSMFRKNFFGIFHGSISAKIGTDQLIINKKNAIFDEITEESLVQLYFDKDYRWNDASYDTKIHKAIYELIHEAKYIAYASPPYALSFSLDHHFLSPQDYFGAKNIGFLEVYDPKNYEDWYDRADVEIAKYMKDNKANMMLIKGYGVYVYDRDINELAKKIAMLEHSCTLINYANKV